MGARKNCKNDRITQLREYPFSGGYVITIIQYINEKMCVCKQIINLFKNYANIWLEV